MVIIMLVQFSSTEINRSPKDTKTYNKLSWNVLLSESLLENAINIIATISTPIAIISVLF